MGGWELAQVNVGRLVAPLTDARLQWFVDALAPVNAVADAAPGFRWRLMTDAGDATAVPVFDDESLIVNMSVWASVEALTEFVYRDRAHLDVLRRRRDAFTHMAEAFQVLWWVPEGHRPTVPEAERRLLHLREHGPTAWAFTFRVPFPMPERPATADPAGG